MHISEQGIALIKKHEGFSPRAYLCPAGKVTIGYGHVVLPHENFPIFGIDEVFAGVLLLQDIKRADQAIERLVDVALTQGQFDALSSFIYNVGESAFEHSTLLRLLNDSQFTAASRQFMRWVYANGKKLDGLVKRRSAEAALFNSKI